MENNKGKTLMLLGIVVILCLCVSTIAGIAGFAYFNSRDDKNESSSEDNDSDNDSNDDEDDSDVEPTTEVTSTPKPTKAPDANAFSTSDYTITPDKSWTVEKQGSTDVVFYAKNPSTVTTGLNNNLFVNYRSADFFEANTQNCDDLAEGAEEGLTQNTQYEIAAIDGSGITTIGDMDACYVEIFGVVQGISIDQYIYFISDEDKGTYAIIISTEEDSPTMSSFKKAAETFEFK